MSVFTYGIKTTAAALVMGAVGSVVLTDVSGLSSEEAAQAKVLAGENYGRMLASPIHTESIYTQRIEEHFAWAGRAIGIVVVNLYAQGDAARKAVIAKRSSASSAPQQ